MERLISTEVSVDVEANGDGTYDVYIGHNGSSGLHYPRLSAKEIGEHVTDYVNMLEEE